MSLSAWAALALIVAVVPFPLRAREVSIRAPADEAPTSRTPTRFDVISGIIVALACLVLLPWPVAPLAGVAFGALAWQLLPSQLSSEADNRDLAIARTLPDAVDLLAALLRTGLTDGQATARVADAAPAPLGPMLARVARNRRLGATAHDSWKDFLADPVLASLAQAMVRHAETGAGVAMALDRVAADARRDFFTRAQAAARAASVKAVIPLAACFLPSFFLLCVAPIVAGLFSGLSFF